MARPELGLLRCLSTGSNMEGGSSGQLLRLGHITTVLQRSVPRQGITQGEETMSDILLQPLPPLGYSQHFRVALPSSGSWSDFQAQQPGQVSVVSLPGPEAQFCLSPHRCLFSAIDCERCPLRGSHGATALHGGPLPWSSLHRAFSAPECWP